MIDFLPLFPLKLVVFPGEDLNLHIFEPKYKQLIRECEENGITFGVPSFVDDKMMSVGTEVQLISVEKRYGNGELDIKTKGMKPFKILEYYKEVPQKLYSGADIERVEDRSKGDSMQNARILELLRELFKVLNIQKTVPSNNSFFNTYQIAHHVGFSLEQEYQFLCLPNESERQNFMEAHLINLIPVVKQMENLRSKAQMNGHFKHITPPDLE